MAKPIKDTPVLSGKDARNFDALMEANKDKKVSSMDYARIKAAAKKFKLINA
jgi:hypothetical protein